MKTAIVLLTLLAFAAAVVVIPVARREARNLQRHFQVVETIVRHEQEKVLQGTWEAMDGLQESRLGWANNSTSQGRKIMFSKKKKHCALPAAEGKGSVCNSVCVSTSSDTSNCGSCGHQCRFEWLCCAGRCVNVMRETKHCGSCEHTKCKTCVFGMCDYAEEGA